MAETTTTTDTSATTSTADAAVAESNAIAAAEATAAAAKTAENIAAAKVEFDKEAERIKTLPEAERAAAQTALDEKVKAAGTVVTGKPVVPEKYDLKLPEGSKLDPAFVERTAAIARELGLDQKGAERLLATRTKELTDVTDALKAPDLKTGLGAGPLWIARDEAFRKQAFADKAFGNNDKATFDTMTEKAQQGLKILEAGAPEIRALLNESGWGSNPVVLRALASLGKRGSEGEQVRGSGGGTERVKSAAEQMYPSMFNDDGSPKT